MKRNASWYFTAGRVFMLCLWSFLLGSWVTNLALHLEFGLPVPRLSVTAGIVVAVLGIGTWLGLSRRPSEERIRPEREPGATDGDADHRRG
jgi:small neutral amino acid transporter SnatA (MarC family)